MWLDIIIFIIIILSMVFGYRNGFLYTVLSGAGWIISIALAFFTFPHVAGFFVSAPGSGSAIRGQIIQRFQDNLSTLSNQSEGGIPKAIMDFVQRTVDDLSIALSESIATICYNIVVFLIMVLIFKVLTIILVNLFSNKSKRGLLGGLDNLFGLLIGGVKGLILVFVLLALMLPVSLFISESARLFMEDALFSSFFTKELYDNNLLLLIVSDIFKI